MSLKIDVDGLGWSDTQAAEACGCSARTVFSLRQRLVEEGLEAARLAQIACSQPPEGQARWMLKLLAVRVAIPKQTGR